ncbi:hypothetical protein DEO72_LG1g2963 [Vigna unguiculata]|uniref:Uncharacterized protein n=1 Tax=Vigna unguiculata TaxID=3917 RepID=A0A4D6KZ68_VIGUN|nr:hypothetical protein DEO72_LG1g2963 [Vigna unguiculata]
MSFCHSYSSCTCNGWGKKNPSLSSRGVGGSRSLGSHRFATSGNEDGGCNYFKWWTEDTNEEIGNSENCEGRGEILVKTEESDGDRKTITNLEK